MEYEVATTAGSTGFWEQQRPQGGIGPQDVAVGICRLPGGRWIHYAVTCSKCVLSDSSNAEVTLTLAPPSAGGTTTDVPPSRRRPPAVFVDHSVQGSRRKIHICIADGRCLRKIEVECGNDEDEDKDKDDDPTSLLAPLLDYNGGEPLDLGPAVPNFSFAGSARLPRSGDRHAQTRLRYVRCQLERGDDFAGCVHWCSHSAVAVGLPGRHGATGGGVLFAEFDTDGADVAVRERVFVPDAAVAAAAHTAAPPAEAPAAPLQRLWTGLGLLAGSSAAAPAATALPVAPHAPLVWADDPTVALGSFADGARLILVAVTEGGCVRLWDTSDGRGGGGEAGDLVCGDTCLLHEVSLHALLPDGTISGEAAGRTTTWGCAAARISALGPADRQAPTAAVALAVRAAGPSAASAVAVLDVDTRARGVGVVRCSHVATCPSALRDVVSTASPAILDVQLHAPRSRAAGTSAASSSSSSGSGSGGKGDSALTVVAAWEWQVRDSTDGNSGDHVRTALSMCDLPPPAAGAARGHNAGAPVLVQMALAKSCAYDAATDDAYGAASEEDSAVCEVLLCTAFERGEAAEVIERRLKAAMMQRIFLPGRFHLSSVEAAVLRDVPVTNASRRWPSHGAAATATAEDFASRAGGRSDGGHFNFAFDAVAMSGAGAGGAASASTADVAEAVLEACQQWALQRLAEAAAQDAQFPWLARLLGNIDHATFWERYSMQQLLRLQCVFSVFLDFLELCTCRAGQYEGLTAGCLERHDATLSGSGRDVPVVFGDSCSIGGGAASSSSFTVLAARRSYRVSCLVVALPPGPAQRPRGVDAGSTGTDPLQTARQATADLLHQCDAAVPPGEHRRLIIQLWQLFADRPVVHDDAAHEEVTKRMTGIARSVQHLHSDVLTGLEGALAQLGVRGEGHNHAVVSQRIRALLHLDDDTASLEVVSGPAYSDAASGGAASPLALQLLLGASRGEVGRLYRRARAHVIGVALLVFTAHPDASLPEGVVRALRTEILPLAVARMLHWALLLWLDRVRPSEDVGSSSRDGTGGSSSLSEEAANLSLHIFANSRSDGGGAVVVPGSLMPSALSLWRRFCLSAIARPSDVWSMARALAANCRPSAASGLLGYLEASGQYAALARAASVAALAVPRAWGSSGDSASVAEVAAAVARDRLSAAVSFAQVMESVRALAAALHAGADADAGARLRSIEANLEALIAATANATGSAAYCGGQAAAAAGVHSLQPRGRWVVDAPTGLSVRAVREAMSLAEGQTYTATVTCLMRRVAQVCETSDVLLALIASQIPGDPSSTVLTAEAVVDAVNCLLNAKPALFLQLHQITHLKETLELAKRIRGFLSGAVSYSYFAVGDSLKVARLTLRASYALADAVDEALAAQRDHASVGEPTTAVSFVCVRLFVEQAIAWSRVFEYALDVLSLDEALDAVLRLLDIERSWNRGGSNHNGDDDTAMLVRRRLAQLGAVNWSWRVCLGALVLRACDTGRLGWLCSLQEATTTSTGLSTTTPSPPPLGLGSVDSVDNLTTAIGQELLRLANSVAAVGNGEDSSAFRSGSGATALGPNVVGGVTSRAGASFNECLAAFLLSRQQFREAAEVMCNVATSAQGEGAGAAASALAVSVAALSVVSPAQGFAFNRQGGTVEFATSKQLSLLLQCELLDSSDAAPTTTEGGAFGSSVKQRVRALCHALALAADANGRTTSHGPTTDRLGAALHLALHADDHASAAVAVKAMARRASAQAARRNGPASHGHGFAPSAGRGLGTSAQFRASGEGLSAVHDALYFFDGPGSNWAMYRAAVDGVAEANQQQPVSRPLLYAFNDVVTCPSRADDEVASSGPGDSPSDDVATLMRTLVATGNVSLACDLAVHVLSTSGDNAAGKARGRPNPVPYHAVDAVLLAAERLLAVFERHEARLASCSPGHTPKAAQALLAEKAALTLSHAQVQRTLRIHFATLLSTEVSQ